MTALRIGALLHDIGKANKGFQAAVSGRGDQKIRHEHLSAWILGEGAVGDWLATLGVNESHLILAAVLSHHLKSSHEGLGKPLTDGPYQETLLLEEPEVASIFARAAEIASMNAPSPIHLATMKLTSGDLDAGFDIIRRRHKQFQRAIKHDRRLWRLCMVIKAGLMAADAAGSAMTREGTPRNEWLREIFERDPIDEQGVQDLVAKPRVSEIERKTGRPFVWHDFQETTRSLGPRALLLAACGAGKTLAAWRWIAAQLRRQSRSRIIFLYPTRATATEGFRDYVSWSGREGILLSGTSAYDIQGMFGNPADDRDSADYVVNERLFALGYWPRRVFSATVDSFLSFVTNRYASICLLPVLVDSVVVIDEVHSFDQSMFRSLDTFLRHFNVRVLCMTATLPPERLRILRDTHYMEIYPRQADHFADLDRLSRTPRYEVASIAAEETLPRITEALAQGLKVMWVVNTVDRCQQAAKQLREHCSTCGIDAPHLLLSQPVPAAASTTPPTPTNTMRGCVPCCGRFPNSMMSRAITPVLTMNLPRPAWSCV